MIRSALLALLALTPGTPAIAATVSTQDMVALGIRYLRSRGWLRLALIATTDATGQDIEERIDTALARTENLNVRLVARERFKPFDLSIAEQMARIKAANPQALYAAVSGKLFGTVLNGMSEAGLQIPVYTTKGTMTYDQMAVHGVFRPR